MPKYKIIKLTDMSPMHIGLGRDSYDVAAGELHSDTITAALASLRAIEGKDRDIKEFLDSFALSSAFPYCDNTLFLPKPAGKLNVKVQDMEEQDYRKLLKKVKYIAQPLWSKIIRSENITIDFAQLKGHYLLDSPCNDFTPPMASQTTHRVRVPRADGKDAEPFAFEWTFFKPKCGLFCLLEASPEIESEVIDLFNDLGEQGIGSDRNVGGGHFGIDSEIDLEIDEVLGADATMLLSMYIPEEQELQQLNISTSRYQLAKRGGFIAGSSNDDLRHLRKNTIYMFTAGSVFNTTVLLSGKVVDLRPAWNSDALHPVYRSGRALSINIKTNSL